MPQDEIDSFIKKYEIEIIGQDNRIIYNQLKEENEIWQIEPHILVLEQDAKRVVPTHKTLMKKRANNSVKDLAYKMNISFRVDYLSVDNSYTQLGFEKEEQNIFNIDRVETQ